MHTHGQHNNTPSAPAQLGLQAERYLELFEHLSPLLGGHDSLRICEQACVIIANVLEIEACSFFLSTPSRETLELVAATHIPREVWSDVWMPTNEGICGEVFSTNRSVLVNGPSEFRHWFGREPDEKYPTPSCLVIPVVINGVVEGVVNVTNPKNRHAFETGDLTLLEAVVKMIAGALDHARHYSESMKITGRLEDIFNNLLIGVVAVDSKEIVRHHNARLAQLLRLTSDDRLDNQPLQKILPGTLYNVCHRLLDDSGGQAAESLKEKIHVDIRDQKIALEVTVRRMGHLGFGFHDALLMIKDVTDEEEIARLRYAEDMKHCFLGIISHELRTPLTVIKGALPMLSPNAEGEYNPAILGQLQKVLQKNTRRLTDVVNSILMVTEIENGTLALSFGPIDLNEMLHQLQEFFKDDFAAKRLNFEYELDDEIQELEVDRRRLRHVLSEMLNNAIKFSHPRQPIRMLGRREDEWLVLDIINYGQPISETVREQIFKKFYQGDDSSTRQVGGVGLGLFLSYNIIRLHGGELMLLPTQGEETVFQIRLPLGTHRERLEKMAPEAAQSSQEEKD